jgi:hypothetical protein
MIALSPVCVPQRGSRSVAVSGVTPGATAPKQLEPDGKVLLELPVNLAKPWAHRKRPTTTVLPTLR